MALLRNICAIAAILLPLCSGDCPGGVCAEETSLLQVGQRIFYREHALPEEVPRVMTQALNKHGGPPSEEISVGVLPEVLRKAADEDLAAIKKAKAERARRAKADGGDGSQEAIKNPSSDDIGKVQKSDNETPAEQKKKESDATKQISGPSDPGAQQMDSARVTVTRNDDQATNKVNADPVTMKEITGFSTKKRAALDKEEEFMQKAEAAQAIAHEAAETAQAAMKNASSASLQATKWHEAAAKEHLFFEKAAEAERTAMENGQAQQKVQEAQTELATKAASKEAAKAELLSATKTAGVSEKSALASVASIGLSFAERAAPTVSHDSPLASYERSSGDRDDWADW